MGRTSIFGQSKRPDLIQDDDTKSESPELGQALHDVPPSNPGSTLNVPEHTPINNTEMSLKPAVLPYLNRLNGHEAQEIDQELGNPRSSPPRPLVRPMALIATETKPLPPDAYPGGNSYPSKLAYKVVRDIYDITNTDTEKSQEHPQTPRAKRLKITGGLSAHTNGFPEHPPISQSEISLVENSAGPVRRGSGITESELNWLRTQEKSVCKPSRDGYEDVTHQTKAVLHAVQDDDHGSIDNGVIDQKFADYNRRETSRRLVEEQEDTAREERVEREREAEADRLAKESERLTEQERKAEVDRIAAETKQRVERERKAEAERISEEDRQRVERERKVEADRVAREQRKQDEQERKAEEERLFKQKVEEAAAASKAEEERAAREADEKAEQKRLIAERRKVRAKESRERKKREQQEAEEQERERKEEQRMALKKKAEAEKLLQVDEERVAEELAARRQKAKEDEKKAKPAAREVRKRSKMSQTQAEKDRKAEEGKQKARALTVATDRHSPTHLSIPADTVRDNKRGSSTPLIPGISLSDQSSSDKRQPSTTPTTGSKDAGLEVQVPLPSALKQSSSTMRRSVSFAEDKVPVRPTFKQISHAIFNPGTKIILPPGATENDLNKVRARTPQAESSKVKPNAKSQSFNDREPGVGKIQTKLNIKRDVKLKGRVVDPPVRAKSPEPENICISSDDVRSPSPFYSDEEADPRRQVGVKAGPSRSKCASRSGSNTESSTARMKTTAVPLSITSKAPTPKPGAELVSILDDDSVEDLRSEPEAGSHSDSTSRSPARYVSHTPVSRSMSASESGIMSSPSAPRGLSEESPSTFFTSLSTAERKSRRAKVGKTDQASQHFQPDQASSQKSRVTSSQSSIGSIHLPKKQTHTLSAERDLEENLQRDISRSSVQPLSSQKLPSPAPSNPKSAPSNLDPPTKPIPQLDPFWPSSQPRPNQSRFPSLTSLKNNPPKWDLDKGSAAPMPDFMKPKPRPAPTYIPPKKSLFMSPGSQQKIIELGSDEDDESSSSSDSDTEPDIPRTAMPNPSSTQTQNRTTSAGVRRGVSVTVNERGRTPASGNGSGRGKYGSVLKSMWPFGSSSQSQNPGLE